MFCIAGTIPFLAPGVILFAREANDRGSTAARLPFRSHYATSTPQHALVEALERPLPNAAALSC